MYYIYTSLMLQLNLLHDSGKMQCTNQPYLER